jgi:hypothetical protein
MHSTINKYICIVIVGGERESEATQALIDITGLARCNTFA